MNFKSFFIRAIVALIFGPLVLFLTYQGGYFLLTLVLAVTTISYWEFKRLVSLKGAYAQFVTGELFIVAVVVALFVNNAIILPLAIGAIILVLFIELYRKKGSPLLNSAATLFGALYLACSLAVFC